MITLHNIIKLNARNIRKYFLKYFQSHKTMLWIWIMLCDGKWSDLPRRLKVTNRNGKLHSKCKSAVRTLPYPKPEPGSGEYFLNSWSSVIELGRAAAAASGRGEGPDGGSRLRRAAMAGAHQIQIAPCKPTLRLSLSPSPRTSDTSRPRCFFIRRYVLHNFGGWAHSTSNRRSRWPLFPPFYLYFPRSDPPCTPSVALHHRSTLCSFQKLRLWNSLHLCSQNLPVIQPLLCRRVFEIIFVLLFFGRSSRWEVG